MPAQKTSKDLVNTALYTIFKMIHRVASSGFPSGDSTRKAVPTGANGDPTQIKKQRNRRFIEGVTKRIRHSHTAYGQQILGRMIVKTLRTQTWLVRN